MIEFLKDSYDGCEFLIALLYLNVSILKSKFLMNNVRNYGRILIPNVKSWDNILDVNVFELKEL